MTFAEKSQKKQVNFDLQIDFFIYLKLSETNKNAATFLCHFYIRISKIFYIKSRYKKVIC